MMRLSCCLVALALNFAAPIALAQGFGDAFEGMRDSDQPLRIEADRLEVTDQDGIADFVGNVSVVQGSTIIKTQKLRVYYARDSQGRSGPGGDVRRIEASGKVAVRSRDQFATANEANVDMEREIATLSGDVSVSQGSNIITGCVVKVDLKTNNINVEPCGGRVKVLIDRAPGAGQ